MDFPTAVFWLTFQEVSDIYFTDLKEENKVVSVPHLPRDQRTTAVAVDAIYAVRNWLFHAH